MLSHIDSDSHSATLSVKLLMLENKCLTNSSKLIITSGQVLENLKLKREQTVYTVAFLTKACKCYP